MGSTPAPPLRHADMPPGFCMKNIGMKLLQNPWADTGGRARRNEPTPGAANGHNDKPCPAAAGSMPTQRFCGGAISVAPARIPARASSASCRPLPGACLCTHRSNPTPTATSTPATATASTGSAAATRPASPPCSCTAAPVPAAAPTIAACSIRSATTSCCSTSAAADARRRMPASRTTRRGIWSPISSACARWSARKSGSCSAARGAARCRSPMPKRIPSA